MFYKKNRIRFLFVTTIALCSLIPAISSTAAGMQPASSYPKLFGTNEIKSSKLDKFRKWTGVLARYHKDESQVRQKCRVTRVNRCSPQKWQAFLKEIASLPLREQINQVNTYFNRHQYIIDPVNYGVRDYWATPFQFFRKDGDCEDYAISKYLSLRKLGVPVDNLRIVVLRDLNLKVAHAILVVYYKGEPLVLDNQISQVVKGSINDAQV